jgi:uncharacterized membrane protein
MHFVEDPARDELMDDHSEHYRERREQKKKQGLEKQSLKRPSPLITTVGMAIQRR